MLAFLWRQKAEKRVLYSKKKKKKPNVAWFPTYMSWIANNTLLGGGVRVRVGIREQI